MQINTRIFRRILTEQSAEAASKIRIAAVKAIIETMKETYRFGDFDLKYIEGCADARLEYFLREI